MMMMVFLFVSGILSRGFFRELGGVSKLSGIKGKQEVMSSDRSEFSFSRIHVRSSIRGEGWVGTLLSIFSLKIPLDRNSVG